MFILLFEIPYLHQNKLIQTHSQKKIYSVELVIVFKFRYQMYNIKSWSVKATSRIGNVHLALEIARPRCCPFFWRTFLLEQNTFCSETCLFLLLKVPFYLKRWDFVWKKCLLTVKKYLLVVKKCLLVVKKYQCASKNCNFAWKRVLFTWFPTLSQNLV